MSVEANSFADEPTGLADAIDLAKTPSREREENLLTGMSAVIGRKWHPVIVRQLLEGGPSGFSELKEQIDGISGKVLSENLKDLEGHQIVERRTVSTRPHRVEYSLTEPGRELEPMITAMREWGREYLHT
ncbi:transcriptional regulator (plasmid) [Haloferax mediterranei ATCC 33500]|nr:helix-turn-helix domain-containing protein [Haloferax mediterranei]AHZ24386.1 hypothetical protein BM92_15820 [Haloferax mediterranei ATCC 33500]ELZ97125.1 hypothetical protein C439_17423 [Haloferax mediterranei ATCC 33500]MDX5990132.1 helix-turn-helix domain-containing protein [Haloferax mediterranei ATCC 33500]QCQ76787.1 transcriptional regulator [Haloferax mediterranei ATCC 33500]